MYMRLELTYILYSPCHLLSVRHLSRSLGVSPKGRTSLAEIARLRFRLSGSSAALLS
jgi:hypothetical protein